MPDSFTAAATRALNRAHERARQEASLDVQPAHVLLALFEDRESRAAQLLAEHGVDCDASLALLFPDLPRPPREVVDCGVENGSALAPLPLSTELRVVLSEAEERARSIDRGREISTEHVLAALLAQGGPLTDRLVAAGLKRNDLLDRLASETAVEIASIPLAPEIPPLILTTPGEGGDVARILDASSNRAREGLRVIEDYVRFALADPMLTRRLKECRHRLGQATRVLDAEGTLVAARDTPEDVGTHIMTASEQARENPRAVLAANFRRTAEALRSLEEYAKLVDVWLAGRFEVLRYDIYTLESVVMTSMAARWWLADARLCLLVGGLPTFNDLVWVVGEALEGGVQVVQLREKGLDDREWLRRACEVRKRTARACARFVVNDRADLALMAGADGVHLGQHDVSIRDARRVVGHSALVGVSTHDGAQLEQAVLAGASYMGVGPVFSSATKSFTDLAGLDFVRQASATTTRPWFAIGGITTENLDSVLCAGAQRVAVSASIVRAERPKLAAAEFRARLDALPLDTGESVNQKQTLEPTTSHRPRQECSSKEL